jgi:hypothetical protein
MDLIFLHAAAAATLHLISVQKFGNFWKTISNTNYISVAQVVELTP